MRRANICINLNIKNINNIYTYNIPSELNYIDVGSFISFFLTHQITPALFEGSYNLYIKYSSAPKDTKFRKKSYRKWAVLFTENELASFCHINNIPKKANKIYWSLYAQILGFRQLKLQF